jgi:tRNA 2-thiocytidine biosynthesis protein TtcA
MLADWERQYPGRTETIFRSISNVAPSQLGDRELFDFAGLQAEPAIDTELYIPAIRLAGP